MRKEIRIAMKLWDKEIPLDKAVEAFTVGDDYKFDQELLPYDCVASMAHTRMLHKIGILTASELEKIIAELERIREMADQGQFEILPEHEDCHTAIELHLTDRLGTIGKKVHTARSRNDQVLTALRLYYRDKLDDCQSCAAQFQSAMGKFREKWGDIEWPGYTHTRKAMPSSVNLWASAFIDSMQDNAEWLRLAQKLNSHSPLGSGAGYGVPLAIDRAFTAELLGFQAEQENPIYVQMSRGKFEAQIVNSLVQAMLDLNRLATDLILFSLPELGYVTLPPEICTGSSIMPHKFNPDVLELVRAKYHPVVACEIQLKMTTANLITGYHRDLQLTKEPVFRAFRETMGCLNIMAVIIPRLIVNRDKCAQAMTPEIYSTTKAYELVEKGMSFRDAYKKVAQDLRKSS